MPDKIIAVDLDDTLNDFTATLAEGAFAHGGRHPFPEATFARYLALVRAGASPEGDLLSTEYTFFRYRIHQECYERAQARPDAVEFMQWLRAEGWRIVICTYRDLRRAHAATRAWLEANRIPFDDLFGASNKIVFCRAWGIPHLIDDDGFNILHGQEHGVRVYYPALGAMPAWRPRARAASAALRR